MYGKSAVKRYALWALLATASWLPALPSCMSEAGGSPGRHGRKGITIDNVDRDVDATSAWMRIRALSDTPVGETWFVVKDIKRWDQFISLFRKVEVLQDRERQGLYKLHVSPPWPLSDYHSTVRVEDSGQERKLYYWIEEGFMFGTSGTISAGEDPDGCWLLFENVGPPQRRFPEWMVKIGVHLVLPSVLRDIHRQVLEMMRARPGNSQAGAVGSQSPGTLISGQLPR